MKIHPYFKTGNNGSLRIFLLSACLTFVALSKVDAQVIFSDENNDGTIEATIDMSQMPEVINQSSLQNQFFVRFENDNVEEIVMKNIEEALGSAWNNILSFSQKNDEIFLSVIWYENGAVNDYEALREYVESVFQFQ